MPHTVLSGTIDANGLASRLREIEETCATGVIVFRGGEGEGEVRLVQGQLAMKQPVREDGQDPVEVMLGVVSGDFEVLQQLPPLPVSSGDDTKRSGSLEVHVAADLMNYCERAGLTGWLILEAPGGDRAEIGYDRGELSGIRLQGPADLQEVFRWEEGHFEIEAVTVADAFPEVDDEDEVDELDSAKTAEYRAITDVPPKPRKKRRDDTAQNFLRVVEMTLAQIAEDREQHRPASRTGPPLPPVPATRESVPAPSAPAVGAPTPASHRVRRRRFKKTPTIPIVYIDPSGSEVAGRSPKEGLRHVKRGDMTAEVVLTEASPERRSRPLAKAASPDSPRSKRAPSMSEAKSEPTEPKAATKAARKTERLDGEPKGLPSVVWAIVALLVVLAALATLAALPRVD